MLNALMRTTMLVLSLLVMGSSWVQEPESLTITDMKAELGTVGPGGKVVIF